jgi:hypothetical protein
MSSAFKQLFTQMIEAGGDAKGLSKAVTGQQIKVQVKESTPHFLVSDGHFFVPAYFTAEAVASFRTRCPNVSVENLAGKIIQIQKWNLEMRRVDSNQVWTSYSGLEVRLIVQDFRPRFSDPSPNNSHPTNLFRDDEFKTTIQHFRFCQAQAAAAKANPPLAPLNGNKGAVAQGVVSASGDEWNFKQGATKTVSLRKAGGAVVKSGAAAAKVAGGKAGKKADAKAAAKPASSAVKKFTPGKPSNAKKSVVRKGAKKTPSLTPGKKSEGGTANIATMAAYNNLIKEAHKRK